MVEMVCEDCPYRSNCEILKQYQQADALFNEKDRDKLRLILEHVELHEAYLSEMRRDLLKKINQLTSPLNKETNNYT